MWVYAYAVCSAQCMCIYLNKYFQWFRSRRGGCCCCCHCCLPILDRCRQSNRQKSRVKKIECESVFKEPHIVCYCSNMKNVFTKAPQCTHTPRESRSIATWSTELKSKKQEEIFSISISLSGGCLFVVHQQQKSLSFGFCQTVTRVSRVHSVSFASIWLLVISYANQVMQMATIF